MRWSEAQVYELTYTLFLIHGIAKQVPEEDNKKGKTRENGQVNNSGKVGRYTLRSPQSPYI